MPEGDSIIRYAVRLRPDLVGEPLTDLVVRHRGVIDSAIGKRVKDIEVRGKNTLIHIETGAALHIHLGMNGRWSRHPAGAPRRSGRDMDAAVVATEACEWRCARAMRAEILEGDALRTHPALSRLGPDVLADNVDWDEIVRRARDERWQRRPIADLLLAQSVACGLGTIYRSEALFVCRQSPWTPVVAVSDERLRELYQAARRLMLRNIVPGTRRITSDPGNRRAPSREGEQRAYVYDRTGSPCLECGRRVESRRHGDNARLTYFCRWCQIEQHR